MPKLYESPTWLRKRYLKDGKGVEDIAKECGVHHTTITRALIKQGLIKNTRTW